MDRHNHLECGLPPMSTSSHLQPALKAAFLRRYPQQGPAYANLRVLAEQLCIRFLESGLGDKNALRRICSPSDAEFWQQMSEVIVADQLTRAGLAPTHKGAGPDFRIEQNGQTVWIEVICPTASGIPAAWMEPWNGTVRSLPHLELLLRWTAAIDAKAKKLLGDAKLGARGYREAGLVAPDDAYVIAVNGRLLRSDFPELEGISQFPFAAEAVFAIGPIAATINRETGALVGSGQTHRPMVKNANGALVPAKTFLDPNYAPISAIWALDADENAFGGTLSRGAVVHNPQASSPVSGRLLPSFAEYAATLLVEEYEIKKLPGRLQAEEA